MKRKCTIPINLKEVERKDIDWIQLTQRRVALRSSGIPVIKYVTEEGRLFLEILSDN